MEGTDIFVVRELTGGIYFGEPRYVKNVGGKRIGANNLIYNEDEIARVANIAFEIARKRKNKVTSLDKANVLEVMQLWRDVVTEVHKNNFQDVELEHLYIDNAAMQVIKRPSTFDVILAGNLFGDIISDEIAELTGSLGMLPSASIGSKHGIYEPVHGSAPDIAGKGIANPMAQILTSGLMMDHLGEPELARKIENSVKVVLEKQEIRSPDIGGNNSTTEVGNAIINELNL